MARHSRGRRFVIVVLMVLAHLHGAAQAGASMAHVTTHNIADGRCHEDMDCWNCRTMGNHLCGSSGVLHLQGGAINLF